MYNRYSRSNADFPGLRASPNQPTATHPESFGLLLNRRKARATRQLQGSLALTTNHASEPLHILKGIARQELRLEDVQDF